MHNRPSRISLTQSLEYAHNASEPINALYDALNLSSAYVVAGRHEEALALARTSLDSAKAMKHAFLAASFAAAAAEACLRLGALDDAERYANQSLRKEEESHRPYALTTLGGVAHARSDFAQAERLLSEAIDSAQQASDRYAEAHAWLALSEQSGLAAEAQQAREMLRNQGN